MKNYLIIHLHECGYTTFRINTTRVLNSKDTYEIVEKCNIDYEPMKGETIEIVELSNSDKIIWLD